MDCRGAKERLKMGGGRAGLICSEGGRRYRKRVVPRSREVRISYAGGAASCAGCFSR